MSSQITRSLKTPGDDLTRKREELADLLTTLSNRELELAGLRRDLAQLEGRYLREVGILYSELDSWNARIRDLRIQRNPLLAAEQDQFGKQAGGCGASTTHSPAPSRDLKLLYRNAARRIHPDLVCDPLEQERRTRFMAEANRAYQAADAEALQRILEDFHFAGDAVPGESAGAELLRIIRQVRDARDRLSAIGQELSSLRSSEIAQLRRDVDIAAEQGRDMLAELAEVIRGQIQRAEKVYAILAEPAPLTQ
jgi:hypothetical protein